MTEAEYKELLDHGNLSPEDKTMVINEMRNALPQPSTSKETGLSPAEARRSPVDMLKLVHAIDDTADKYVGAPIRAGIASNANSKDKTQYPIETGINAAKQQFGEDTEKAPNWKQTMETTGLSGAPASDTFPGAFKTFDPKNEESYWDMRPEKGGLFDVSPAGVVGGILEAESSPVFAGFGKLRKLIGKSPEALKPGTRIVTDAEKAALEPEMKPSTKTYDLHPEEYKYASDVPNPEAKQAIEDMAKQVRQSRIQKMLSDRQKSRAKFIDQDTEKILKGDE